MKRLTTLATVPKCASLVDGVLANDALLGAWSQLLNKKCALLSKIVELTEEVLEVVLDLGLVAFVFTLLLVVLNFFLSVSGLVLNILDVSWGRAEIGRVFKLTPSFASRLNSVDLVLYHLLELLLLLLIHNILSVPTLCFKLFISLFKEFTIWSFWLAMRLVWLCVSPWQIRSRFDLFEFFRLFRIIWLYFFVFYITFRLVSGNNLLPTTSLRTFATSVTS